jgi:Protein of unknown function (DUF2612)
MIEQYLKRLAFQFSDSEKLKGLLTAHLLDYDSISLSLEELLSDRYLDTAQGIQLDGIGEIVGLKRPSASTDVIGAFGFDGDETSQGFGSLNDIDIGGNFVSLGSTAQLIGDDLYRILIKVKIQVNKTAMTNEDVIAMISFALDGASVRYILAENTKPTYEIGRILTSFEILVILPLIPVLIGIDEANYKTMHNDTPFGFADDPSAFGFGSLTDSNVGGNFATLI